MTVIHFRSGLFSQASNKNLVFVLSLALPKRVWKQTNSSAEPISCHHRWATCIVCTVFDSWGSLAMSSEQFKQLNIHATRPLHLLSPGSWATINAVPRFETSCALHRNQRTKVLYCYSSLQASPWSVFWGHKPVNRHFQDWKSMRFSVLGVDEKPQKFCTHPNQESKRWISLMSLRLLLTSL